MHICIIKLWHHSSTNGLSPAQWQAIVWTSGRSLLTGPFKTNSSDIWFEIKLEQLECLHSEIPPAAPWLPILVIHIRSQVKTRQSQIYKLPKIQILKSCKKLNIWHTFWSCLIRRTDGQTEWNQYTPPNNFVVRGGVTIWYKEIGLKMSLAK